MDKQTFESSSTSDNKEKSKEILNNMAGTYISNDYYNIEEFAKLMENGVKEKLDPQLVDRKISLNFIDVIGFRIQYEIIEN